ncbi:MAG: GDP-mannose 4,6-dehydratase [Candidatus Omnitrophica bacterium]|nr:GDP-mannose 4,6-dehydratase [Candidatus Omnitrophota bacterium]
MNYKNILITGGCGFIGSNLAMLLRAKYPSAKITSFDNLIRKGSELNVERLKSNDIEFIKGDIRNESDLEAILDIDLLIECSAEPSVLAGYGQSPKYLIDTNLMGTINCLELARKNKADVVFLSTSRVYPYDVINQLKIKEEESRFVWEESEDNSIAGFSKQGIGLDFPISGVRSMYGATKLCSEIIFNEYIAMYGLKGVINRCGVVAGPWQFGKVDQGVFTFWMLKHYFKKPLSYIGFGGKGKQVRDLLHVDDLFDLIDLQINSMDKVNGQIYNVGGGKEISLSLLETTKLCQEITNNKIDIGSETQTRPADLAIYLTDNSKVNNALGWKPKRDAKKILEDIYNWIEDNEEKLKVLIS